MFRIGSATEALNYLKMINNSIDLMLPGVYGAVLLKNLKNKKIKNVSVIIQTGIVDF